MNDELYREAVENERAVLGAMLNDKGAIGEVCDYLFPRDFYSEQHRHIYSAIVYLYSSGKPVDVLTVSKELREKNVLERSGGSSYVSGVWEELPDTSNIMYYAETVKMHSLRRSLSQLGRTLVNSVDQPQELLNVALEELIVMSNKASKSHPERLGECLGKELKRAMATHSGEIGQDYVLTGYSRLDQTMLGMKPGDLIIVAARPSVGKSAFTTNVGMNIAKQGKPVLFCSLEMSMAQLTRRILSMESGVSYTRIDSGLLTDADVAHLRDAEERLRTVPFIIDDKSTQTLAEIRTTARREQAKNGLSLLIVDYMQLIGNDPSDFHEISKVSVGLKGIAKDLNIPVIGISQMSRNIEHRDNKEPMLSDLRSSGQIEQDADIVSFLFHPNEDREIIRYLQAKNRNGPLGFVDFKMNHSLTKFHECPPNREVIDE